MSIRQSMLVFASVANLVEDYRSENALCAGGNPLLRHACGIIRSQSDHLSKSLKVKFSRDIVNAAKFRGIREIPWDCQRHNNLAGINPDRRDHEIRREEVKTVSWGQYFGTSKLNTIREEMIHSSKLLAREKALTLERITGPKQTRCQSPSFGNQGQKQKSSEGNRTSPNPIAGGNPNASHKSEINKRKTAHKREAARIKRKVTASRDIREYLVDSGAAFHIVNKSLLTNEELRTVRKLDSAVKLQTANGIIAATHQAKVKVMELDLTLWAIILKDSPCLISMGKLCRECGYTLTHEGAKTPVLTKGQLKVPCQTVYDVPYITPFGPPEAGGNPEAKPKENPALKSEVP
jgi:hypothetical protein